MFFSEFVYISFVFKLRKMNIQIKLEEANKRIVELQAMLEEVDGMDSVLDMFRTTVKYVDGKVQFFPPPYQREQRVDNTEEPMDLETQLKNAEYLIREMEQELEDELAGEEMKDTFFRHTIKDGLNSTIKYVDGKVECFPPPGLYSVSMDA